MGSFVDGHVKYILRTYKTFLPAREVFQSLNCLFVPRKLITSASRYSRHETKQKVHIYLNKESGGALDKSLAF